MIQVFSKDRLILSSIPVIPNLVLVGFILDDRLCQEKDEERAGAMLSFQDMSVMLTSIILPKIMVDTHGLKLYKPEKEVILLNASRDHLEVTVLVEFCIKAKMACRYQLITWTVS